MAITRLTLDQWDKPFRTQFVNSLPGFKSLNLIGSRSPDGQENLAVFSSVTHLGSNPPMLSFWTRPASVPRHTLSNIAATGVFSLNAVATGFYPQAHHTSARYPQSVSEFTATGLTPWYAEDFAAPFVAQSPLKIGLQLCEILKPTRSDCQLVIGEISLVFVDERHIKADGHLDLTQLGLVCVQGLDHYCQPVSLGRLPYAKPDPALL